MERNALAEIDPTALAFVHGGQTRTKGRIGFGAVELENVESDYKLCLDNLNRQASDLYPDNRWFWQRWRGDRDTNAVARNQFIADRQTRTCPLPTPPATSS